MVQLPQRPRHASAEAVLAAIRAVVEREPAWGVRQVWATLRRDGLRVSRRRVWALMHAHGLVLVRDREPGEPMRGHVAVPEPNRRFATDLTTTWTRRDWVVAIVPPRLRLPQPLGARGDDRPDQPDGARVDRGRHGGGVRLA